MSHQRRLAFLLRSRNSQPTSWPGHSLIRSSGPCASRFAADQATGQKHAVKVGAGLIPFPAETRRGPGDPEVGQRAGDLGLQHAEVLTREVEVATLPG